MGEGAEPGDEKKKKAKKKKKARSPKKSGKATVKASDVLKTARERDALEGKVGRKLKDVKDFLESMIGPGTGQHVQAICKGLLKYIDGSVSDRQMSNLLIKHCIEEPETDMD